MQAGRAMQDGFLRQTYILETLDPPANVPQKPVRFTRSLRLSSSNNYPNDYPAG
jgi:hypothetical protein